MLKVGLVGVGGISGAHIPALMALDDVRIVAVADIRPERARAAAERTGARIAPSAVFVWRSYCCWWRR